MPCRRRVSAGTARFLGYESYCGDAIGFTLYFFKRAGVCVQPVLSEHVRLLLPAFVLKTFEADIAIGTHSHQFLLRWLQL